MAKRSWIWDFYPLHPSATNHNRTEETSLAPGTTFRRIIIGGLGGSRVQIAYRPTEADMAILRRAYPDADPGNPSWPSVEADLITGGRSKADLAGMNAPTLLRLLDRRAEKTSSAAENMRETTTPGARRQKGQGVTWQEAKAKAEAYVEKHGWPGRNSLAMIIRCSTATVDAAVKNSTFLAARKAEHMKNRPARFVPLGDGVLKTVSDRTALDPRLAAIDELAEDQQKDRDRDERRHQQYAKKSKRTADHMESRD